MWINKREGQCFAYLVLLSPITLSSVILLRYIKLHYCNSSFNHLHSLVRATMRRTPARALPCVSLHWWFSAYKESYFNNFQQITLLCKKTVPINMETTHLFLTWGNNIQSSTARLQKRVLVVAGLMHLKCKPIIAVALSSCFPYYRKCWTEITDVVALWKNTALSSWFTNIKSRKKAS